MGCTTGEILLSSVSPNGRAAGENFLGCVRLLMGCAAGEKFFKWCPSYWGAPQAKIVLSSAIPKGVRRRRKFFWDIRGVVGPSERNIPFRDIPWRCQSALRAEK